MKFVAILVGIAAVIGIFFYGGQARDEFVTTTNVPTPQSGGAALYLSPQKASVSAGKTFPVELKLVSDDLTLSAAAIRVIYTYSDELPFEPLDTDPKREGIQGRVNPALVEAGWSVPINKVIVDDAAKTLTYDLALVNLSVEGYHASADILVATLDFTAKSPSGSLTFDFSTSDTKLITKVGEEANLGLQAANYKVKRSFLSL